MTDFLEKLLLDLNEPIDSESSSIDIVKSIENYFDHSNISNGFEGQLHLLLGSKDSPNILTFLTSTSRTTDKVVISAKKYGLKFIAKFIKQHTTAIGIYAINVIECCVDLLKKEDSDDLKAHLVLPLKNIFRNRELGQQLLGDNFSLDELYQLLLFDNLLKTKKSSKTLKSEILKTIGILVYSYSDQPSTISHSSKILTLCKLILDENFSDRNESAELTLVCGALSCLDYCTFHFETAVIENSQLIWKYILKGLSAINNPNIKRYEITRKSLRFIKNHSYLFQDIIYNNANISYEILSACYFSNAKDIDKHATEAIFAVINQIAEGHCKHPTTAGTATLQFLKKEFMNYLNRKINQEKEVYLAIQGFAAIAPCLSSLDAYQQQQQQQLSSSSTANSTGTANGGTENNVVLLLIQSAKYYFSNFIGIESISSEDPEGDDEAGNTTVAEQYKTTVIIRRKAAFFVAIASVLHSCVDISIDTEIQDYIQMTTIELIAGYSQLSSKYNHLVVKGFSIYLHAVYKRNNLKSSYFIQYSQYFLNCLLIRTLGHLNEHEIPYVEVLAINNITGETDTRLYAIYYPLWNQIFTPLHKDIKAVIMNSEPSYSNDMIFHIYDHLMTNILSVLDRLNLEYTMEYDQCVPKNLADQEMLLNLASFLELFLPQNLTDRLLLWLPVLIAKLTALSQQYLYISPLYRLIGCQTQIAKKCQYFVWDEDTADVSMDSESGVNSFTLSDKSKTVWKTLQAYLSSLCEKMKSFQQKELLLCVLKLVLTCPQGILILDKVAEAISVALNVGLAVSQAIEAMSQYSIENLRSYLPNLLPLLDPYISSLSKEKSEQITTLKSKYSRGISKKLSSQKEESSLLGDSTDPDMLEMQRNIIRLLGRLGGENKHMLLEPVETIKNSLAWGDTACVALKLPFQGVTQATSSDSLTIYLDRLLPRLALLCKQTNDRQLSVLAAETLHAIIIIMIGRSKTVPVSKDRKSDIAVLYSKIFPTAIFLSVSREPVCRQLFDGIMRQIIHWFSGLNQVHPEESEALLDALMEGLADESDSSIREFCASCVQEYFIWMIRQSTKLELASNLSSSQAILSRLFVYANHPSSNKQQGACCAFSKIYRILREETSLIHTYALQMLHTLLMALKKSSSNITTSQDCVDAVRRYSDMIVKSVELYEDKAGLLELSTKRAFPRNVQEVIDWLWSHLSHQNTTFRRVCMQTFGELSAVQERFRQSSKGGTVSDRAMATATDVTRQLSTNGFAWLTALKDNPAPNFTPMTSLAFPPYLEWLRHLDGALDTCTWLLKMSFIAPSALFEPPSQPTSAPETSSRKRKADKILTNNYSNVNGLFVVENIPIFTGICQKLSHISHSGRSAETAAIHAKVWRRVVQFLSAVLSVSHPTFDSFTFLQDRDIWNQSFYDTISTSLLEPSCNELFQSSEETGVSEEVDVYLPGAIEELFICISTHQNVIAQDSNIFTELGKRLNEKLGTILNLSPKELKRLITTINLIDHIDNCREYVFSSNHSSILLDVGLQIMNRIFDSNEEINMITVQEFKILFRFAIQLGVPLVSSFYQSTARSILDFLMRIQDESVRESLYIRYEDEIIYSALGIRALKFQKYSYQIVELGCNQIDVVKRLLHKILEVVLEDASILPDTLQGIVNAYVSHDCRLLADKEIRLLTLQVDAKLPSAMRNLMLHSRVLETVTTTIQNPTESVSAVISDLQLLPYLLSGVVSGCPRPISEFPINILEEKKVRGALEELVASKFPLISTALDAITPAGKAYSEILKIYLELLSSCGAVCLFEPLFPTLGEGTKHRYYDWIRKSTDNFISALSISPASQKMSLCGFAITQLLDKYKQTSVKNYFYDICLQILNTYDSNELVHLLTTSGSDILGTSDGNSLGKQLLDKMGSVVSPTLTPDLLDATYLMKAFAFDILRIVYDRCPIDIIKKELTKSCFGPSATGKELNQAICRFAYKQIRGELPIGSTASLPQKLHSAAFNCLMVVVAKSQTEEQHFDMFIFTQKPGEAFWKNVVDCSVAYSFDVKTERGSFPTEYLGFGGNKISSSSTWMKRRSGGRGIFSQYLSGTALAANSLSQSVYPSLDVLQSKETRRNSTTKDSYDLSSQAVISELSNISNASELTPVSEMEEDDSLTNGIVQGFDDVAIGFELNDINKQPCMGTLVRVIQRLATICEEKWRTSPKPKWLSECLDRLVDTTVAQPNHRRNIRLFMLRLFLNQPVAGIIAPWANEVVPAVLQCCEEELCRDDQSTGYHYVLRDVVFNICTNWRSAVPNPTWATQAGRFLSFLIEIGYNGGADTSILRENCRSIRQLISLWVGIETSALRSSPYATEISLDSVVTRLSAEAAMTGGAHGAKDSRGSDSFKQRLYGLEIIQELLHHGFPLNQQGVCSVSQRILDCLASGLMYPRKEVYEQSANTIGLLLKLGRNSQNTIIPSFTQFPRAVESKINSKFLQEGGVEASICSIWWITKSYPEFLNRELLLKLLSSFSLLKERTKIECLDIFIRIPQTSEQVQDVPVLQYLKPHLLGCLNDLTASSIGRGASAVHLPLVQINILKLLRKYVKTLDSSVIQILLGRSPGEGLTVVTHEKAVLKTREAAYDLMFDMLAFNEILNDLNDENSALRKKLETLLLRGLNDTDDEGIHDIPVASLDEADVAHSREGGDQSKPSPTRRGIRRRVFDFFHEKFHLSVNPSDRLLTMMEEIFPATQSDDWLQQTVHLLVSLCHQARAFKEPLYEHGLCEDDAFMPVEVTGSRGMSLSIDPMLPIFSIERTSQLSSGGLSQFRSLSQSQSQSSQGYSQSSRQSWSTQSRDVVSRKRGFLRGTQQVNWANTQAESNALADSVDNGSESVSGWSVVTSTQAGFQQSRLGTQPASSALPMAPPKGLPSRFAGKILITQRVPIRFGGGKSNQQFRPVTTMKRENKKDIEKAKKSANVVVYRRYRAGELPDIRVPLADILRPLTALSLRDKITASILYSSVFETIYDTLTGMNPQWVKRSHVALQSMLFRCSTCPSDTLLVGTLMSSSLFCIRKENSITANVTATTTSTGAITMTGDDMTDIDATLIADLSLSTLNYHSGIQLLEEKLQSMKRSVKKTTTSSRPVTLSDTDLDTLLEREYRGESQRTWMQLSRLYTAIEEHDILLGITAKMLSRDDTNRALDAEISGDYIGAIETYNKLISEGFNTNGTRITAEEKDLWDDRSLECLHQLLEWGQLKEKTQLLSSHSGSEFNVIGCLNDSKERERLLPLYARSIINSPSENKDLWKADIHRLTNQLLDSDNSSQRDTKDWVIRRMSPEVAVSYAILGDWMKSRTYIQLAYNQFITSWSSLRPCAVSARHKLLQGLQQLVEVEDSATIYLEQGYNGTDTLLNKWELSQPAMSDRVVIWNDIVSIRTIAFTYHSTPSSRSLEHLARFHSKLARAAIDQGILHVVRPQLRQSTDLMKRALGRKPGISHHELTAIYLYNRKSILREESTSDKVTGMFEKTMTVLQKKREELEGQGLTQQPSDKENLCDVTLMSADLLSLWSKYSPTVEDTISKSSDALQSYLYATEIASNASYTLWQAQAYGKLAQHANNFLEKVQNSTEKLPSRCPTSEDLADIIVSSIIKGTQLGNQYCRDHILHLMHLIGEFPKLSSKLSNHIAEIPAWMFLRYSAQLMGCLDRPEGPVVASVLEHVATRYPKALYYPCKTVESCLGSQGKRLLNRTLQLIHDDNLDKFVESLQGLTHPELRLNDMIKELMPFIRDNKLSAVKELYQQLKSKIIESEWDCIGHKIGLYNKKWIKKNKSSIDKLCGGNGELITQNSIEKIVNYMNNTKEKMEYLSGKVLLQEFSEWLAEYDSTNISIEIPGQYNSQWNMEPDLSRHVLISSIDPYLLVMSSVRRPKRIKFYGTDGQEYMFLVKGGEDLRNDERIESLFMLMNSICNSNLDSNSSSSSSSPSSSSSFIKTSRLYARTFTVIPMTTRVGVLEWVTNTVPLKAIIEEEMRKDTVFLQSNPRARDEEGRFFLGGIQAAEIRENWMKSNYIENFKKKGSDEGNKVFKQVMSHVPDDFLRRRFLSISTSPEIFLTIRTEFAKSLAVSNIFGYILGIGDRHLDNLLLDVTSGSIVQIDFGVCFGMGASVLGVPELIPFRLTEQLRKVLQPLDGEGLLRHYMVKVLGLLRSEAAMSILSNALEVYIDDPVLDWLKGDKDDKDARLTLRDDVTWEPRRRIEIALKKLKGFHPSLILIEDLKQNPTIRKEKCIDVLGKIVSGSKRTCSDPSRVLSTGEQVDQLIGLATDPNVLVRQWVGLATWL